MSKWLCVALFSLFVLLTIAPAVAQDVTSTELPIATLVPTDTPTSTFVPTITETATATAAYTETASPTTTFTPTAADSPTLALTETPTATLEPTVTLIETPNVTSEIAIPSLSSPVADDTIIIEPGITIVDSDNFESVNYADWSANISGLIEPINGGRGLHFKADDFKPLSFSNGNISDVIAQSKFLVTDGTAQLVVRHSQDGEYAVHLEANGQIGLYRGTTLLDTATVTGKIWHSVQLAAIKELITVTVDGTQIISVTDQSPLPSGMVYISTLFSSKSDFWVDEFAVSGIQESPLSLYPFPEASTTIANRSISVMAVGAPNKIAFSTTRSGNNDIYVMNSDGSGQAAIINNAAFDVEPDWSPDGARLAFSSSRSGNEEIYIVDADGTNLRQLTIAAPSDRSPSWSPDGNNIVFSRNGQICAVTLSNSAVNCLASTPSGTAYTPAWSPNGATILYSASSGGIRKLSSTGVDQGLLTADGGSPAWSPDGSQVAYQSINPGGIFVVTVATGATRQVTSYALQDHNPSWSGDGSQLVFDSSHFGVSEVYKVPSSATTSTSWTNVSNNAASDFDPDWSPGVSGTTATPTRTPTRTPTPTTTATSSGSFPSTNVLDNFNRANNTNIGSNWSANAQGYTIANNKLDVGVGGPTLWSPTLFGANQEVYVTLSTIDTVSGEIDLLLKSQQSTTVNSGVIEILYSASTNKIQVWTYTPGAVAWVKRGTDITGVTFAAGDRFGARARANGIVEVYKNAVLLGSRDVSAWAYYANSGYIGLWFINSSNSILDDFGGGGTGVQPTSTPSRTPSPTQTPTRTPTRTLTPSPTPTLPPDICPASVSAAVGPNAPACQEEGAGLRGDYYVGRDFNSFVMTRTDARIDFPYGSGSPDPSIPSDNFSVIWTGQIRINFTETYTFCTLSDDGVRLWVNGVLLVNNWNDHAQTENCGGIILDAGFYDIRMEYYEHTQGAIAQLSWSYPFHSKEIIPLGVLYPALTPPGVPGHSSSSPLTTMRLREIAINYPQLIWGSNTPPAFPSPTWYGDVGRAFQRLVLIQLAPWAQPNNSDYESFVRRSKPGGLLAVRPDGFTDVIFERTDPNTGATIIETWNNSNVVEVKAKNGTISPSYQNYQIVGMIDVSVASTDLGQNKNMGMVTLVTTSNTIVNADLRTEATSRRVLLCQSIVWEVPGSTPAQSLFWVAPSILLNPEVKSVIALSDADCGGFLNIPGPLQLQGPADLSDPDPILLEEIL